MTTTVNGILVFETKVRGTATSYIRQSVVAPNPKDLANFGTWETAGTSVAGIQTANYGGTVVGANATGLTNDSTTYTASVVIDGTAYAVSVVGSAAQTFTDLVTQINADLPNTEASISGGDIVVTSTGTGKASYVSILDTDLFSSTTGFLKLFDAVPGGTEGQLRSNALTNGANGWDAYKNSVEVYDTAADTTVITTDYTAGDLNATFSDVEVEAELTSIGTKVNSLQNLVDNINKRS